MKLDAGALDRQIDLLTPTKTRSSVGQETASWAVTATLYAQRLELRVSDITRMAGRTSIAAGRYLIRWRTGVINTMRVRIDGDDYNITAIDEPDRRKTLVLTLEWAATAPIETGDGGDGTLDMLMVAGGAF